jgi:hypothetical protein
MIITCTSNTLKLQDKNCTSERRFFFSEFHVRHLACGELFKVRVCEIHLRAVA